MKKLITMFAALALVIIICATLLPTESQAATIVDSGTCGDNLTWVLDDTGTLTISGNGAMFDYDYASVPWYSKRTSINTIVINDSVTSIGQYAFEYCTSLISVTIPGNVTSIGRLAFYSCSSLASVTINSGVTSIGDEAFRGCTSLTSITIPNSVTSIGDSAFYYCTSLTSIVIPDSVTSVGSFAFSYCDSLTSVSIGNGVTSIDRDAFRGCSSLASITIPNSVTSIGVEAFEYCTSLTSVTIPESVTNIGHSAFYYCTRLTNVIYCGTDNQWNAISVGSGNSCLTNATRQHNWVGGTCFDSKTCSLCGFTGGIGDGHNYVDNICIYCGDIRIISHGTCGSNLTWILDGTNTLTISGTGAMSDYYVMPEFSWYAPWSPYTDYVKEVIIEEGVATIGDLAFDSCSSLTSIVIPKSVTSIGDEAFYSCSSLTKVIYCGTEKRWNAISVGSGNSCLTNATREYHNYVNGICSYCSKTDCATMGHNWLDADCTNPKTCASCGLTEGKAMGHLWYGGDCTTENTCFICGETYTSGHSWIGATCTTPKTCSVCGETSGTALGHTSKTSVVENLKEATCTTGGSYDSVTYCNRCGIELNRKSEVISAKGHSYGVAVIENSINATCEQAGSYDSVVYCNSCGMELSRENVMISALGHRFAYTDNQDSTHTYGCVTCGGGTTSKHSYTSNTCVCGHTLIDLIKSSQATLEAMLRLDFTVDKTKLSGTDNYVVLTHTYANGSTDVVTIPQSEWTNSGMVSYAKIAAKEMGDNVTIVVYNAQGQQLSIPETDSIKAYAHRGLIATANTTNPSYIKLRTLLVDMLNYGAAAQVQFKYDTNNLVNADLTDAQKEWATQNDVTATNNQRLDAATYAATLKLESAIGIDFIFYASKIGASSTWKDLYAIATYIDFNGKPQTVRIEGKDFTMFNSSAYMQVTVIDMAVADYKAVVNCVVYNQDGTVLATAADSIEGYAARKLSAGTAGAILEAVCKNLMKFSASAEAYFKK